MLDASRNEKMKACRKKMEEVKYTFLIKYNELLDKCNKISDKISISIKKELKTKIFFFSREKSTQMFMVIRCQKKVLNTVTS